MKLGLQKISTFETNFKAIDLMTDHKNTRFFFTTYFLAIFFGLFMFCGEKKATQPTILPSSNHFSHTSLQFTDSLIRHGNLASAKWAYHEFIATLLATSSTNDKYKNDIQNTVATLYPNSSEAALLFNRVFEIHQRSDPNHLDNILPAIDSLIDSFSQFADMLNLAKAKILWSIESFDEGLSICEKLDADSLSIFTSKDLLQGSLYYKFNELDSARKYNKRVIDKTQIRNFVADASYNLALIEYDFGNLSEAQTIFTQLVPHYIKLNLEQEIVDLHLLLGDIALDIGDIWRAKWHYAEAIRSGKKMKSTWPSVQAGLLTLSDIELLEGNVKKSKEILDLAEELISVKRSKESYLNSIIHKIGILQKERQCSLGLDLVKEAYELIGNNQTEYRFEYRILNILEARIFILLGNFELALESYDNLIDFLKKEFKGDKYYEFELLHSKAEVLASMGLLDESLELLNDLDKQLTTGIGLEYDQLRYSISSLRCKLAMKRGEGYEKRIAEFRNNTRMFFQYRSKYGNMFTQMSENKKSDEILSMAIKTCYEGYLQSGGRKYLEDFWYFTELSKSSMYVGQAQMNMLLKEYGVPESLIKRGQELSLLISNYGTEGVDAANSKQMLKYLQEKDELDKKIADEYPEYAKKKGEPLIASMAQAQEMLAENEVIVSFEVQGDTIWALTMDKKGGKITQLQTTGLKGQIDEMVLALRQSDLKAFSKVSHSLYKQLLAPLGMVGGTKSLYIFADGHLEYLPFELLLTSEAQTHDFRYLPYLLRDKTVHFYQSATAMRMSRGYKPSYRGSFKAAFFAPDIALANEALKSDLALLPGATQEVGLLSRISGGKLYPQGEAHFTNVVSEMSSSNIIHIATHTLPSQQSVESNSLVLEPDTTGKAMANFYDFMAIKQFPELITLSACNTGRGEMNKALGVLSVGKGLVFAGCPSVLMTIWPVDDRTGGRVLDFFYENLEKGMDKAQALREAKLRFLDESDPVSASPYHWGGYVLSGSSTPIQINKGWPWGTIGAGGLVIFALLFLLLRSRWTRYFT